MMGRMPHLFLLLLLLSLAARTSPLQQFPSIRRKNLFPSPVKKTMLTSSKSLPTLTSRPIVSSGVSVSLGDVSADGSSFSLVSMCREGLSGAFAGSVQVMLLMWLRTTMSYQHKYGLSIRSSLRDLYRQGGIRRFYRGVGYAIIQAPLAKFCSVASNDCTLFLSKKWKSDSPLNMMIFTAFGGIVSSFFRAVLMPIDTCKTVLQVDGSVGFERLKHKLRTGDISVLYQGTVATVVGTFVGHYPWYFVHNYLQKVIRIPSSVQMKILKNALIALIATAVSDVLSNSIRVVKTVKQTTGGNKHLSYVDVTRHIINTDGYKGLLGRGIYTRLLSNCIQSMVFTVIWKLTSLRSD